MSEAVFETTQTATDPETAAIAAAIERFTADTAVASPAIDEGPSPWLKAALTEGVSAADSFGPGDPGHLG